MAKPKHSLDLAEQLCFSLYTAQRLVTAAYRPLLDALDLTYSQYVAMLVLWESAPLTMGELGTRLGLDYGTVTPLVKRLEAAGLVVRSRSTEDERTVHVAPTDAGHELRAKAVGIPDSIAEVMALEPAEFATLKESLEHLSANVAGSNE
ncbi:MULTISPECIES: MarR family winged helix-turn-helix transcriptional regulator [unclassified Nocardioides]|uniref:MarR family winged helix-turn-helix transcriptional regulator n=1 Tax=unclassified Nocardioides TaxID=2615069 RepID=UPI000702C77C|nr:MULTISPECIES: MarR family transcriptional regulator [unclassified Nocardioides]KRC53354.1 MarR family transcriptional regulator [Nocardioides sp. Root79]KRC70691.1 MarR family transcriptional regulator [Nocardioides sp. Root240]